MSLARLNIFGRSSASSANERGGLLDVEASPKYGGATETTKQTDNDTTLDSTPDDGEKEQGPAICGFHRPTLRNVALGSTLFFNVVILLTKVVAYVSTSSLVVLAALLDSLLDILCQLVLTYTEKNSARNKSSALYPAGSARLEPLGVLICAMLMGMASFAVLRESVVALVYQKSAMSDGDDDSPTLASFWSMVSVVVYKMLLYWLCRMGAHRKRVGPAFRKSAGGKILRATSSKPVEQISDPTLEALTQDHFNDILSNAVAAFALLLALRWPNMWYIDPMGAIVMSIYIMYSWYVTGKEKMDELVGISAPVSFIVELRDLASLYDDRIRVDAITAYHFGPKFLVELRCIMKRSTKLTESHDVALELQEAIQAHDDVERCFVHVCYDGRC